MKDLTETLSHSAKAAEPWSKTVPLANPEGDDVIDRLIRIKGTAITILLVLLMSNRPLGKQQLHKLTGITFKSIRRALSQLQEFAAVWEDENQRWRIADRWRCQIILHILDNNQDIWLNKWSTRSGALSQSGSIFSPASDTFSPSSGTFSQLAGTFSQSSDTFSSSEMTVVVDHMTEELNKDLQQQQSINSAQSLNSVPGTLSPSSGTFSQPGGTFSQPDGTFSQPGATFSPPSGNLYPANDSASGSAASASRNDKLAGYLKEMGVTGRIYQELLAWPELIQDPSPVRAWWWYSLIQKGIRNPAAMAISYLRRGDPPWRGYLDLVRLWDKVERQERLEIEETLQRNWSAEELAHYWSKLNPEWTVLAFIALKELYLANPAIVGL